MSVVDLEVRGVSGILPGLIHLSSSKVFLHMGAMIYDVKDGRDRIEIGSLVPAGSES